MQEEFLKYKKFLNDLVQAGANYRAEKAKIIERTQSAKEAVKKEFEESNERLGQKTANEAQVIEPEAQSTIIRAKGALQAIRSRILEIREYIMQQGLGDIVPLRWTAHTADDGRPLKRADMERAFSQLDRLVAKTDRLGDKIVELVREYKRLTTLSPIKIMIWLLMAAVLVGGLIKLIKFLMGFF